MTNNQDQQLRKAAILIASLEESLANKLLADMPASAAEAVREAASRLEEIDSEEARDVADQFRQSTLPAASYNTEGVELDASLLARIEQQEETQYDDPVEERQHLLEMLTDAEAATIVDALSHEHPQTVAVVISRLDQAAAGKILARLSPNLQVEVLQRVSELDPADQLSLQVVESHLAQWISQKRQRTKRMAAGAELAQRILQGTSPEDRATILTRLGSRNPKLAKTFGQPEQVAEQPQESPSSPLPKITREQFDRGARLRRASRQAVNEADAVARQQQAPLSDPLGELEKLDDAALMLSITRADRQVVTLALAGASEELMKRILRRLPRRQAKEFRKRLRDIGPTRLSDMLAAQQRLAHIAQQLV
jgi:flagellar motor switch protein FliG